MEEISVKYGVKGSEFQPSVIVKVLELYFAWGSSWVRNGAPCVSLTIFSFQPLLHMCMSQLLEIARASLGHAVSSEPGLVLVDFPQAQALHFLKILVQDSSLRQDIAQYMSSVTIICFSNFSSPVWTVR